jgi:hypothetical protein
MHRYRSSLGLCLMSSLPKGERLGTKLVELFANRVVEGRNMIMSIYGGELALRVLGELISGEVLTFSILSFSWPAFTILLGLPLFVPFIGFMAFSSSR